MKVTCKLCGKSSEHHPLEIRRRTRHGRNLGINGFICNACWIQEHSRRVLACTSIGPPILIRASNRLH